VRVVNDDLKNVAAWPVATLFRGRETAGLIMQRVINCPEIFELYSPAQRKISFPRADWSFLIHTARNLAVAISEIHNHGHVIGDINQKNVVVARDTKIKLIDCDSFQVKISGHVYRCEVGVGHFTPPELQQRNFRDILRTTNHDNFGLAVLIFHLLFMGRHPFAGRFLGTRDMPIETAICESRFAFGPNALANQMAPPPSAPPLEIVSPQLASMFQAAFARESVKQGARPNGNQWVSALDTLFKELRACGHNAAHKYYRALKECPWCAIELRGGPDFFIALTISLGQSASTAANFDLDKVWRSINSIAAPRKLDVSTNIPSPVARPFSQGEKRVRYTIRSAEIASIASITAYGLIGFPLIVTVFFLLVWAVSAKVTPYGRERGRLKTEANTNESQLRRNQSEAVAEQSRAGEDFERKRYTLAHARQRYIDLLKRIESEKANLKNDRRASQLRSFLSGYLIERAQIAGIGPMLKIKLRSWNIETAADISGAAVQAVPGFGPAKIKALTDWRRSIERACPLDFNKAVTQSELAMVERKFAGQRRNLEEMLASGATDLDKLRRLAEADAYNRLRIIENLANDLAQIRADAKAFKWW
jgi:DNA-binding helix-hairpin-helix protein with protein kinase domain